ncbi:LptF/LptG family permease [Reichenbachiella carrageenanivorans]|uniref:LptF/LptG family permease n=1 Tax=Reichenbachiella carrageenanivorans TaxID=2979869 RepID=A0ABY6CWT5_9BACT|nr:LptF/LptG family permease [Reichenbachiella carrageenanivorans]UXX77809.1 LptF/LptG family permease [Reichenbachiella carrageenanivorans]
MKLLDKYILSKFLKTYVFVVGLLVIVIMVIDFTEKNEKYIKNDVPADAIIQYYLAFAPWIANLISPITVFITTVLVTSGMAVKTEIVAILSGGVSFRRMLVPYLMGACMIAVLSFYVNGWLIPDSNKYRIGFEIEYLKKPFYFNERDIHLKIADDDYIYIQRYNNRTESAYRVTLEKIVDNELKAKLFAKKMTWDDSLSTWRFRDWELRNINKFGEVITRGEDLDSAVNISPSDFDTKYQLNATMNMGELEDYIALLKSRGSSEVGLYEIEKYIRYMLPFTAIILTLMGVSVSAEKSTRGGAGFKIALGFVIAFVFILLFVLVKAIAEAGSMHPILAIWIPNIVGLIAALVMYRFVPK